MFEAGHTGGGKVALKCSVLKGLRGGKRGKWDGHREQPGRDNTHRRVPPGPKVK
jgi:hypothetical protein